MELKHTALILLILLAGCERDQWDDCVTSTGPVRTEERNVGAFSAIDLSDRIDLVLEPRAAGTIAVEAGSNLMGQLVTEVNNGTLIVRNDMKCNWVRSFKPRITVHVPLEEIALLTLRGTGNVSATATVVCPVFRIEQHDSQGQVDLSLLVDTCYVGIHTGGGAVRLSGSCGAAYLYTLYTGPIDAGALAAQDVYVNNSGVADITCRAEQHLHVQVLDRGDVRYYGDPEVISTVTGSGHLVWLGP